MTEYLFQEGIPEGFTPDFDSGIFHDTRHLQLQSPTGWHSFAVLNARAQTILAAVHFHIDADVASSPFRSPYGSFVCAETISPQQLLEFVLFAEQKLKGKGVRTLILKNCPEIYSKKSQLLFDVLSEAGYRIQLTETSAVLTVDEIVFAEKLNRSKKGLLKKGHDLLRIQPYELSRLSEVYNFLRSCYTEKGYELSLTDEELKRVASVFPDRFFLHTVFHQETMVAASISILVEPKVLYTFYYNHSKEFDYISPIVFLCERLYQFSHKQGIQLLDLGTSNKGAELNEPLINFKLSLGARASRKLTFIKNLS